MKVIPILAVSFFALSASTLSHAQTNAPVTRAEVRADLVSLEEAGYDPEKVNGTAYPSNIQAAEAKVAQEHDGQGAGYIKHASDGVTSEGAATSSSVVTQGAPRNCVGPRSFCQIYADS